MSTLDFFTQADPELDAVATELLGIDPTGMRWAEVIRHTFDMLYNGQETGRYRWDQLYKTEKTHFGTLFEINGQREFGFYDGEEMDFQIAGVDVDAKWSQKSGGWMLPPESFGHLVLVGTANDEQSTWSIGLARVSEENRRVAVNRDGKTTLSALGREAVRWLWKDAALSPNVLLQLPRAAVDQILESRSGQEKILRLLRAAEGRIIRRTTIATVGRQLDPMKRLRASGGARTRLRPEGYLVLTGDYHAELAKSFGVAVPGRGEVVAFRVVPAEDGGVFLSDRNWRRATVDDAVNVEAPLLPASRSASFEQE